MAAPTLSAAVDEEADRVGVGFRELEVADKSVGGGGREVQVMQAVVTR